MKVLIPFKIKPLSNLFKKLKTKANKIQIIPAVKPNAIVLKKLSIKVLEKKLSEE
jgi:hypothetical protein